MGWDWGVAGPFTFQSLYFCNVLTFTNAYYFCIKQTNKQTWLQVDIQNTKKMLQV